MTKDENRSKDNRSGEDNARKRRKSPEKEKETTKRYREDDNDQNRHGKHHNGRYVILKTISLKFI